MKDIKLHYGARSPTYCDKTSHFVRICLRSLAWWLKYEGPEAQERHPSVKGGSGPTEPSRRALKSLLFSYTEAVPSLFTLTLATNHEDLICLVFSIFYHSLAHPLLVGPESNFCPQMKKWCCQFESHSNSEFIR